MKTPSLFLALSLGLASFGAAAQSTPPGFDPSVGLRECADTISDVPDAYDVCTRLLSALQPSRYAIVAGAFTDADNDAPRVTAPGAVAIGPRAQAVGWSTVAVGDGAEADAGIDGHGAVAVGAEARARGVSTAAVGQGALAEDSFSTALGAQSVAQKNSLAAGAGSKATGHVSTAVGPLALATADGASAFGNNARAQEHSATALGTATVANQGGTAAGAGAAAAGVNTTALGFGANAAHANSVALGAYTQTTAANQIAVGGRTVSQVAAGHVSASSTDAVNGSQLWALEQRVGVGRELAAGENIELTRDDNGTQTVGLSDTVVLSDQGSVRVGGTTVNAQGIAIDNGASVTRTGVDAGRMRVTHVAAGRIEQGSMDAVNGSQIWELQQQMDDRWADVDRRVDQQSRRLSGLGAQSAAMANMAAAGGPHGLAVGQVAANAGVGFYGNAAAFAVGVSARVSERVNLTGGLSFGGSGTQVMGGVGVSVRLGR